MNDLYRYQMFGLNVASDFLIKYIDCARYNGDEWQNTDVSISFGKVPNTIENGTQICDYMVASNSELLLDINKIASYYVKDGKRIIVEPKCDLSTPKLYVFIIGTCMGAILRQKNILTLHSSCVYNGQYGILFMGRAQMGKSTMAAAFIHKGWRLVTDDIAPIIIKDSSCFVQSGIPMQRLWEDSVYNLNVAKDSLSDVWRSDLDRIKYTRDVSNDSYKGQVPLKHIVLLNKREKDELSVVPIEGKNKIRPIMNNIYRPALYCGKKGTKEKFAASVAISEKIDMWHVVRSKDYSALQVAEMILNNIE